MKRKLLGILVAAIVLASIIAVTYSQVLLPKGVETGYVHNLEQLVTFAKDRCQFTSQNPAETQAAILNRRNNDNAYQQLLMLLGAPGDHHEFPADSSKDVFLVTCDLRNLPGGSQIAKLSNVALVSECYIVKTMDANVPLKKYTIDYAYEYKTNPVTDPQVDKIVFGSVSNLIGKPDVITQGVDKTVFFIESYWITPYTFQPYLRWYYWWYNSHHHPNWYYGWWYWHWYWWWAWYPTVWPWWWTWWWSWSYVRYWFYWSTYWLY